MMADYFARMITRHLGLTEVVRPVVPPRFAPLDEDISPIEQIEMETSLAPHQTQNDEPAIHFGESESPSPIRLQREPRRRTSLTAIHEEGGARQEEELLDTPRAKDHRVSSNDQRISAAPEEAPAFSKTPGLRDLWRNLGEIEKAADLSPLRNRETDSLQAPKAFREGTRTSPVPPAVMSFKTRFSSTVKSEDGRKPMIPSRDLAAALKPDRSEPPVIKVRIGRVEVRAVMPPAPPARRDVPQRRPHLSLEDYLRQREGGRS